MSVVLPTLMVSKLEPEPGAAILDGLKVAEVPAGNPEATSEMLELKLPDVEVVIVVLTELPCVAFNVDEEAVREKSFVGLKMISSIGWSSMPLGATPV